MSKVILTESKINGAGTGVVILNPVKKNHYLGRYKGVSYLADDYIDAVRSGTIQGKYGFDLNSTGVPMIVDASDPELSNWTRYMNCSRNFAEENVYWIDEDGQIKFYAARDIKSGEELLFYYGENYANKLGINYVSPLY